MRKQPEILFTACSTRSILDHYLLLDDELVASPLDAGALAADGLGRDRDVWPHARLEPDALPVRGEHAA